MPSALLEKLYHGDRAGAQQVAIELAQLTIFEASALGALEQLIERCEEDAGCVRMYSDDGWTPLHLAAFFGNTACVKDLVRREAVVDARARNGSDVTPLHSACAGNHTAAALVLIGAGADVNAVQQGGYRPIDSARRNQNIELITALHAAGAPDQEASDGQPPPALP